MYRRRSRAEDGEVQTETDKGHHLGERGARDMGKDGQKITRGTALSYHRHHLQGHLIFTVALGMCQKSLIRFTKFLPSGSFQSVTDTVILQLEDYVRHYN